MLPSIHFLKACSIWPATSWPRKTLFKDKLHRDQKLFDRAYGYIRQYI